MYGVESSKTESSGRYFQILKSFFCYSLLQLKEVLSVTKLKSDGFFQAKIIRYSFHETDFKNPFWENCN